MSILDLTYIIDPGGTIVNTEYDAHIHGVYPGRTTHRGLAPELVPAPGLQPAGRHRMVCRSGAAARQQRSGKERPPWLPTTRSVRIRHRQDTAAILELIRRELVPLSNAPIGREALTDRALTARIRQGRTLVAAGRSGSVKDFIHVMVTSRPNAPVLLQIDMLAVEPDSPADRESVRRCFGSRRYGRFPPLHSRIALRGRGQRAGTPVLSARGIPGHPYWPSLRCWELYKPLIPVI